MNENISHNFFIWEEKNSTEPQKNYENKNASETKDTTNDIQTNVENLHWKDITNPKERRKAWMKAYRKDWYKDNKDKLKVKYKNYYESNKQTLNDKQKNYAKVNKDKICSYKKAYAKDNKDKIKAYKEANKDRIKLKEKAYAKANRDKIKVQQKAYREANKDKIKLEKKAYKDNKLKTDIQYKLSHNLRTRLRNTIKGNYKAGSAVRDLGCSIEKLKQHLESKFQPGMTWDNWTFDGWHIDHIKPLASFDLTDRQQLLEACHYTNLQPLWAIDNLSKGDSVTNL